MHQTIQDAIDAINLDTPTTHDRALIKISPGFYEMTATLTIPAYVKVLGSGKDVTQLYNATTDLFTIAGNNVFFSDFLIEGAANSSIYAFKCNDYKRIHVRNVDMLSNGGVATQKFLHQLGSTWETLFIEHCVLDSYTLSEYLIYLSDAGKTARNVDVIINDLFSDTYHLTNYGGSVRVKGLKDVRVKNSTIRGAATYNTGVRLEKFNITSGTPEVHVRHSYLTGGVPIYNESGTNVMLINSDAIGATFAGTSTRRNSSIT